VIGVADELKGQVPLGFLVLKAGVERLAEEVEREAIELVRGRIGPVARFKAALVVAGVPKTRSGKILRGMTRKIADGENYPTPATIDDPAVLRLIEEALEGAGHAAPGPSRVTRLTRPVRASVAVDCFFIVWGPGCLKSQAFDGLKRGRLIRYVHVATTNERF
jgi:hypothetical protein